MSETVPPGDVPGTGTPWRQVHQVGAAAGASAGAGEGGQAGAVAGAVAGAEAAKPFADAAEEFKGQAQAAAVDAGASKGEAELAADAAREQADVAAGQAFEANKRAQDAEAKALLADVAANRSELAAIQATTASPIYPDVPTGLAATAEGSTFNVQGEGATYATTYRKVSGAAVYVADLPSKGAVDAVGEGLRVTAPAAELALDLSDAVLAAGDDAYLDITYDEQDRHLSGHLVENGAFEAMRLKAVLDVEFGIETGQTIEVPGIENWEEVVVDELDRPVTIITRDQRRFEARDGALVEVETAASLRPAVDDAIAAGVYEVPGIEDWAEVLTDEEDRPVKVTKLDGTKLAAQNGALVVVSSGDGQRAPDTAYIQHWQTGSALLASTALDGPGGTNLMKVCIGQSLVTGEGQDPTRAAYSTTPLHPGRALMFNSGPRPDGAPLTSLVDLREIGAFETPCSGIADAFLTGCQERFGFKPKLIMAAAARGGTPYSPATKDANGGLKKGTVQFAEFTRLVQAAQQMSAAEGRRLVLDDIYIGHGENDSGDPPGGAGTSFEKYYAYLNQFARDLEEVVRKITGQEERVRFILYQHYFSTPSVRDQGVARAQLEVARRNPAFICIGPQYWVDVDAVDRLHPVTRDCFGIGRVAGQAMLDGSLGPFSAPLDVLRRRWINSTTLRLHCSEPMVQETTDDLVTVSTLGTGRGLNFDDGSGSPPAITASLASDDNTQIEVVFAFAPTGLDKTIFSASRRTGTGGGRVNGARTAFRSAAEAAPATDRSTAKYRWLCVDTIRV